MIRLASSCKAISEIHKIKMLPLKIELSYRAAWPKSPIDGQRSKKSHLTYVRLISIVGNKGKSPVLLSKAEDTFSILFWLLWSPDSWGTCP
jgi:hypothetical protein